MTSIPIPRPIVSAAGSNSPFQAAVQQQHTQAVLMQKLNKIGGGDSATLRRLYLGRSGVRRRRTKRRKSRRKGGRATKRRKGRKIRGGLIAPTIPGATLTSAGNGPQGINTLGSNLLLTANQARANAAFDSKVGSVAK